MGQLHALDAGSGEAVWSQTGLAEIAVPPIAGPLYVYVGTLAGDVAVFDRRDGRPVRQIATGVPIDGSLTLAEGALFAHSASAGLLVALRP